MTEVSADRLSVGVLGTLRVTVGDDEVSLPSRRQRAVLALLALNANGTVSVDRLADQVWDGAPPPGAAVTLRTYVHSIRKALAGHDSRAAARLVTDWPGYRLELGPDGLDLTIFRQRVVEGHRLLRQAEHVRARTAYDAALSLWRGELAEELAGRETVVPVAAELQELHAGAREGRLRALVEHGAAAEAIADLESLTVEAPLREGPHETLMLALHRVGRSADALEVHRRLRDRLRGQLGVDPSRRLDQLFAAILDDDPRLDAATPTAPVAAATGSPLEVAAALVETMRILSAEVAAVVQALQAAPHPPLPAAGSQHPVALAS